MFSNQVMRTPRVECSRSHVVIVEPEGEFVGLCPEVDVFWLSGGFHKFPIPIADLRWPLTR
jgi:hypothetical protein